MSTGQMLTSYFRFDTIEAQMTEAPQGRALLFSDPGFQSLLGQRLDDMLSGGKILSLDVFDTFVLRDNSSELTRFYEIGGLMAKIVKERADKEVSQVDAFTARYLGTKATYRASRTVRGCREGSLEELHRTASRLLVGDTSLAESFIKAELDYEATRLEQNPFLVQYLRDYRAAGGRAVLVSDMYMHATQVGALLSRLGIAPEDYDLLMSSGDTKVSKASGGIFSLVESQMGEGAERFVHVGDSFRGDLAQPVRRGWQALHLPLSDFDIVARRKDHIATFHKIQQAHGLTADIAMPH
mgnify:CR=1 FL=1